MAIHISPYFAVHPGVWAKEEIIDPSGLSVTQLSQHFGVSRQAVSSLLNGRVGMSADMAIRFEKVFCLKAETLCRMQAAYDLAQARTRADDIIVKPYVKAA